MWVRDCWYVIAWDHELPKGALISRTLLDEPIVLYRNSHGEAVALADRCSHRFAALSLGRVEGDDIRCMYHGVKFHQDGRCAEIPGQDMIPEKAAVRAYPLIESDSWLWVWMGKAELADPALVPQAVGLQHPDWRMTGGQMEIAANYQLINDNLCDLTHLAYVHPNTLGKGSPSWADSTPVTTRLPRGIRSERWLPNAEVTTPDGSAAFVDQWNTYDFLAPGVFLLRNDAFPPGSAAQANFKAPETASLMPLSSLFSSQAISPISEKLTRYFYSIGPDARGATPEEMQGLFAVAKAAFEEDKVIEEAQQLRIDSAPDAGMLTIATYLALNMMRKVMREIATGDPKTLVAMPPSERLFVTT